MKPRRTSKRRIRRDRPSHSRPSRGGRFATYGAVVALLLAGTWGAYRLGWLSRGSQAAPKLNLLLVTLDTTRADHLGCYGSPAAQTPNLDQLAREGIRFEHCSTSCPLTLPAHASIMTAVWPYVHGARWNGTRYVSAANNTLAESLHAAGYQTRAAVGSFVLNRQFGLAQGFDVYHDVVPPSSGPPLEAERRGDVVCDDALRLLQSVGSAPFFLWVHFYDPHLPYVSARHPDRNSPAAYADEVTFMDEQVGRLLAELRRLQLDARTLVVAIGDHGEGLGQHEEPSHANFLYETTLHVPLIMRCPGVLAAGQTIAAPVRNVDLAPTILELLGCPPMPAVQGTSLVALLHGQDLPAPLPAYAETLEASALGLSPLRSLRLGSWKYILAPEPELYDLAVDPGEEHDLAAAQPELATQFRRDLRTLIAESPPPVPVDPQVSLTTTELKRLESLGYVVGNEKATPSDLQSELDNFEPRGGNPRSYAKFFQLNARARDALDQGHFAEAERLYRQMIDALPAAPQPYSGLADALGGQQRLEEAIAAVQKGLELAPDNLQIRARYAALLSDAGRWDDAAAQFQMVLQVSPQDPVVLHNLGVALAFLGRLDEAERHFQLGLSIEPESPCLLQAMGVLRSRQGRPAEAAAYLRKALAIDPNFKQAAADLQNVEAAQ